MMRAALSRLTFKLGLSPKVALAIAGALVVLTGATAGIVYARAASQPTTVTLTPRDGAKDVATDVPLRLSFSRAVGYEQVRGALALEPAAGGSLFANADRTRYTFKPATAWADLTTYTITLRSLSDAGGHRLAERHWHFTTTIVPRVTSVTDQDGNAVAEGAQLPTGTQLILSFNTPMDEASVTPLVNGAAATVHWHADAESVRIYLQHVKVGPLTVGFAAGGRDRSGHHLQRWSLHALLAYIVRVHTVALPFPALIQVPNDPTAWDQAGLQSANIVFEYDTEGGIRRMTALFENMPDAVGPIRSGRLISFKLVRHYRGMLFLSGLSEGSMQRFRASPVPALFDEEPPFYRTTDRYAPNNLFISGAGVLGAEQRANVAPWQIPYGNFSFPNGGDGSSAGVAEHDSSYTYDADTGTYTKSESGHQMADAAVGDALHIAMVVVVHTKETPTSYVEDVAGAHGLDFDLQSGGRAEFYFGGVKVSGTWSGADLHSPLTFKSDSGQAVTLPPGLVWVDVVS
jgi:DUF3048 family protein/Big-like domain-containing protein